jgi:hypothetical protein
MACISYYNPQCNSLSFKHTKQNTRETHETITISNLIRDWHPSGPILTGGLQSKFVCLHGPSVAKEGPKQEFQFGIVLPHSGMVGPISISMLECFPAVHNINVRMTHFLLKRSSIGRPPQGMVDLNPHSQGFLAWDRGWDQLSVGIKELLQNV